jgi:hypothetical protein
MQMWMGPSFNTAIVSRIIDLDQDGWQIQIALQ